MGEWGLGKKEGSGVLRGFVTLMHTMSKWSLLKSEAHVAFLFYLLGIFLQIVVSRKGFNLLSARYALGRDLF